MNVLPQVKGSSITYEGPYDATSVLAWLHTIGQGYMKNGVG